MRIENEFSHKIDPLATLPVPTLFERQLDLYTKDSIRTKPVAKFNISQIGLMFKKHEGQRGIAVDIGGCKIEKTKFFVLNASIKREEGSTKILKSTNGEGYLTFLEEVSKEALINSIPVSISFPGIVEKTRPITGILIPKLMEELNVKYKGDMKNLIQGLKPFYNDAVSGLTGGAIEVHKMYPNIKNIIYLINGSGIGGAVLKNDIIFATEPAHLPIIAELNPLNQTKRCGFMKAEYTCLGGVAGGKEGIEDIWFRLTKQKADGNQIVEQYIQGNKLATDLYDNSAQVIAHVIRGVGKVFNLFDRKNDTAIVLHGGTFKVPGYIERVKKILKTNLGYQLPVLFTKNFSSNACIDGAAIMSIANLK